MAHTVMNRAGGFLYNIKFILQHEHTRIYISIFSSSFSICYVFLSVFNYLPAIMYHICSLEQTAIHGIMVGLGHVGRE